MRDEYVIYLRQLLHGDFCGRVVREKRVKKDPVFFGFNHPAAMAEPSESGHGFVVFWYAD